jgi:hypothetical protein
MNTKLPLHFQQFYALIFFLKIPLPSVGHWEVLAAYGMSFLLRFYKGISK